MLPVIERRIEKNRALTLDAIIFTDLSKQIARRFERRSICRTRSNIDEVRTHQRLSNRCRCSKDADVECLREVNDKIPRGSSCGVSSTDTGACYLQ
jgi:hypothetical protein